MTSYSVFYMKPEWFPQGILGKQPYVPELHATHAYVTDIAAKSLQDVWQRMQAENWPTGEYYNDMLDKLESRGLKHSSMSVGDVIQDLSDGKFYVVANEGFIEVLGTSHPIGRWPL